MASRRKNKKKEIKSWQDLPIRQQSAMVDSLQDYFAAQKKWSQADLRCLKTMPQILRSLYFHMAKSRGSYRPSVEEIFEIIQTFNVLPMFHKEMVEPIQGDLVQASMFNPRRRKKIKTEADWDAMFGDPWFSKNFRILSDSNNSSYGETVWIAPNLGFKLVRHKRMGTPNPFRWQHSSGASGYGKFKPEVIKQMKRVKQNPRRRRRNVDHPYPSKEELQEIAQYVAHQTLDTYGILPNSRNLNKVFTYEDYPSSVFTWFTHSLDGYIENLSDSDAEYTKKQLQLALHLDDIVYEDGGITALSKLLRKRKPLKGCRISNPRRRKNSSKGYDIYEYQGIEENDPFMRHATFYVIARTEKEALAKAKKNPLLREEYGMVSIVSIPEIIDVYDGMVAYRVRGHPLLKKVNLKKYRKR